MHKLLLLDMGSNGQEIVQLGDIHSYTITTRDDVYYFYTAVYTVPIKVYSKACLIQLHWARWKWP